MRCAIHDTEAFGVCAYCGRAVCTKCGNFAAGQKLACSDQCLAALGKTEKGIELLLQKSQQSARASAFYSYLCGGLSLFGAIGAGVYLPVPFLVWFTAGCAVVFIASGIRYSRIARNNHSRGQ